MSHVPRLLKTLCPFSTINFKLMTLKDLSSSEDEDLQELASSIEHNVFYEEKQLNMLNLLCKHCKNESKRLGQEECYINLNPPSVSLSCILS